MIDRPEIAALLNYYQADEDGVMVTVSRQAIHETVAYVDALLELLQDIRPYVYGLDNIKRIDAALERT